MNRGNAGKGRPKGSPNKATRTIREAVLASFDAVGAEDYLVRQAHENPVAYLSLLGKILPTQVTGADGGAAVIHVLTGISREHEPGAEG